MSQRLELTWIGKNHPDYDIANIEPRILIEDPERSHGDPASENMLIHGDNLLALKALLPEYEGEVKCIYIDPPYNTGNTWWLHYDDSVEHSIWLSLMRTRLVFLQLLLSDNWVFYIQLDDNEMCYARVICDEIFGRSNFIACLPVVMNLKWNQDQFWFAGTHEYILCYAKNINNCKLWEFSINEEEFEGWEEDEIWSYKRWATLKATWEDALREKRPKMFYPLLFLKSTREVTTITTQEHEKIFSTISREFNDNYIVELRNKYESMWYEFVLPKDDNWNYTRWRWGYNDETKSKLVTDVIVVETKNGVSFYKKQRPEIWELPTKKAKSFFYKPVYSSGNGTSQIKTLFGTKSFPYPKPEELISDLIQLSSDKWDLILDSFLGSGTTAAVAHKMGRRWIGIEMGEHAYTHCQVRLDKVIEGEQGGISKSVGWEGGGGYKFYELAPSFITTDEYGNRVIDAFYDDTRLIRAMCKLLGYTFRPSDRDYFRQGIGTGQNSLFVTTQMVSSAMIREIAGRLGVNESLMIATRKYEPGAESTDPRVTVRKIPQSVLKACQYGKKEYLLPIRESAMEEVEEEE
jgi:adenine-specific DNA-methyltransferase